MKRHKPFGPTPGDLDLLLCDAEIWEGSLFDLDGDAKVTPANSFGNMGGGIDQAIDRFYEGRAQDRERGVIRHEFYGELPVGAAFALHIKTDRFPYLIVTPTRRRAPPPAAISVRR